jgi:hypothetical protein
MAPLEHALDTGVARAGAELGIRAEHLPAEVLGVALQYAVLDRLLHRLGSLQAARRQIREGAIPREVLRTLAEEDLAELQTCAARTGHQLTAPWLQESAIASRVIDLALDALFSEPLAPALLLPPIPERLPAAPIHGLIFSAFPHITHELYPLMIDAYVANPALQVVGVHLDWLRDGSPRRVITFDFERHILREIAVADTPRLASAQTLGLNLCQEQADHRRVAALLPDVPLLNPVDGAAMLDDKARTGALWKDVGLDTPAFVVLPPLCSAQEARERLMAFLAIHGLRVVIKPADGTEGRQVGIFDAEQPDAHAAAFRHLEALRSGGSAMMMAERGRVRALMDGGPTRCVVRINACWDGTRAWAESGYAQVAGVKGIASAGQGGRVIALQELWGRLCHEDGLPITPTGDDWARLLATARDGARVLGQALATAMPALIGLDLLLDIDPDGRLQPVLLEANPRPSGMARCMSLTPDGPLDEPGISPHFWTVVSRHQH